ncbi:hypothetical protein JOC86_000302 [Bacillus pakistanensis]|uniref:Uncharacterized protein n=1 Tax=Rossellomorea pakistanensis TaxID=992288 RepID=A0ABS2N7C9_9BACI|nr:hypothetical protein [Bacillus pakistanensis]MBM7583765.1 hypothetical protein [Bacillus pakistanensis]
MTVILTATILIDGKTIETDNLFIETIKRIGEKNEWKSVRSYIEAGIPIENLVKSLF